MTDARSLAKSLLAGAGPGSGAGNAGAPAAPARPASARPARRPAGQSVGNAGAGLGAGAPPVPAPRTPHRTGRRTGWRLEDHPGIRETVARRDLLDASLGEYGLPNPYYLPHRGISADTLNILDGEYVNFSSFNYLCLASHPRVQQAAKDAVDEFGTSSGANRIVSGQTTAHLALERKIAESIGTEDACIVGSGYLTNAATIAYLAGPDDLSVLDSLAHNSIVAGTEWGGSQRMSFAHNDPDALRQVLSRSRQHFNRALVVIEGIYSMDGDITRLPEIVAVAKEYDCLVMVDEAHSIGVLGAQGHGVREHFDLDPSLVDVWMGTMSKALASYGGYLAASADACEAFRMSTPGLNLYSTAPPPMVMAAATEAMCVIEDEPDRLQRLHANAARLAGRLRDAGTDIGLYDGTPIVPAIIGGARETIVAAQVMLAEGINVNPIAYPAVPEGEGRLRFFVTSEHTHEQIDRAADVLAARREIGFSDL